MFTTEYTEDTEYAQRMSLLKFTNVSMVSVNLCGTLSPLWCITINLSHCRRDARTPTSSQKLLKACLGRLH